MVLKIKGNDCEFFGDSGDRQNKMRGKGEFNKRIIKGGEKKRRQHVGRKDKRTDSSNQ